MAHKVGRLNGRILGDMTGSFTCHQRNGSSVVDYSMVTENLLPCVSLFKVEEVSPLSDHCMVSVVLHMKVKKIMLMNTPEANHEVKLDYAWDSNSKDAYVSALKSPVISEMLKNLKVASAKFADTGSDINLYVHKMSEILTKAADISLRKKCIKMKRQRKVAKKWHSKDCDVIKRNIQWLGKLINKYPRDPFIRGQLCSQQKIYKSIVKKKTKSIQTVYYKIFIPWKSITQKVTGE